MVPNYRFQFSFSIAFLILFFAFKGNGHAMEVFLARVLSISPSFNDITVTPLSEDATSLAGKITVRLTEGEFPPGLQAGRIVKLWGTQSPNDPNLFMCVRISGMGSFQDDIDATGVHRRLGRDSEGGSSSGGGRGGGKGGGGGGGGGGGRK
jgi:uncharacterized membrane protein YgcG